VKPAAFTYHAPRTVEEALALLGEWGPREGRVLAGGQSLVPAMALRLATPAHLIDINDIAALRLLQAENGWLRIGAGVRHSAFEQPVVEGRLGELLASVVRHVAHHPIRTRGTFCGSLAHADPASEWCLVATTLDAELVARSERGTRTIAACDFFTGVMSTALAPDELLVEARLPLLAAGTRFGFHEFSRRAGDFAIAMALVVRGKETRIGVGGAEARPRRIPQAEAALARGSIGEAANAAAQAVVALSDPRYSADYRRDLVRTVVRRALEQAGA
jgi:aerobic carbon-monoxide dehydrogenase medium subunit